MPRFSSIANTVQEREILDAYLRDWLVSASGYFIDSSVDFAEDLSGAPIGEVGRRTALPTGEWVLLEKRGSPLLLAGIEPREVATRRCFTIFEHCVIGESRVSFWECKGHQHWALFRDASFLR